MTPLIKKPSAWIPIAIPLTFFAILLYRLVMFGPPVREADEGTLAHLFQLWLVLEVFMVSFFAIKWLPQAPKQALVILAIQIIAALLPISVVFYFNL